MPGLGPRQTRVATATIKQRTVPHPNKVGGRTEVRHFPYDMFSGPWFSWLACITPDVEKGPVASVGGDQPRSSPQFRMREVRRPQRHFPHSTTRNREDPAGLGAHRERGSHTQGPWIICLPHNQRSRPGELIFRWEKGPCRVISYVNGDYVTKPAISVFDRGFVIGDGVYDSARTFGGQVFKLDEHLQRLGRSMRYIEIDADRYAAEIRRATEEVIARNMGDILSVGDVWVIQIITRGLLEDAGESGFGLEDEPDIPSKPTIVVILRPLNFKAFGLLYRDGVDLGVSLLTRALTGPLDPRAKSTGKLAYSRAERKAARMSSGHALGAKAWTVLFHDDGSIAGGVGSEHLCRRR